MSSVVDSFRTFIAIELPRAQRAKLIGHIQKLRAELPDARASWSREHNLHLTLKFLGNIPVDKIPKLSDAIANAVRNIKPFELTVAGCGVFPPRGRPNVLWIGVGTQASGLLSVHESIERELSAIGFPREQRAFHPHLTIARLRKHGDERRLAEAHLTVGFAPQTFTVSEVSVFRSTLTRDGSKHDVLSRHELLGRN